jgi:hypothetical protein
MFASKRVALCVLVPTLRRERAAPGAVELGPVEVAALWARIIASSVVAQRLASVFHRFATRSSTAWT